MSLGNSFIWEVTIIVSVTLIIFCGLYPFIAYYFSLHPFPTLFLPKRYKEHLQFNEIVNAIQSTQLNGLMNENIDKSQPMVILSSEEIEMLTKRNTIRNSICQGQDDLQGQGEGLGQGSEGIIEHSMNHHHDYRNSSQSTQTRYSLERRGGVCTTFHLHQITEENIARRTIQWNPLVTMAMSLMDQESNVMESEDKWVPLPSVHGPLKNIVPRGILRNRQEISSQHRPSVSKQITLSLVNSNDDSPIEETVNPLFPASKKIPSSFNEEKDVSGWRKRMEAYAVYRAKPSPRRHLSLSHRPERKSSKGYSQFEILDEFVDPAPLKRQQEPKIRRHSHNSHPFPKVSPPNQSASLLQATIGRRHTHGSKGSQDAKKSTKRHSPPPVRYDHRGQRIIELEELETPHHPIWIGVDHKERIAYEKEFQDHGKEGGGGDVYLMGVIGREEKKMIGGRFKDIV